MGRFRTEVSSAQWPQATAELVAGGVSRHALVRSRWRRTSRGFYVPGEDHPAAVSAAPAALPPAQRILEAAAVMPTGAVLGGWAAAFAYGAHLIDGLNDYTMRPEPVIVNLAAHAHRYDVPGIRYVADELDAADIVTLAGIRFTSRRRTALDLARRAPDLTEAVVALDALLAARVVTRGRLRSGLADIVGRRGARQARRAVELCRLNVRSSWETRLRLLYVLDLGLPCPEVNPSVYDLTTRLLGEPDLLDVEAGLVMEYDGATWRGSGIDGGHRNRKQHRDDNVREEQFERAGLLVARADKADLTKHRAQLRDRLLAARADGLARDRSRDRWRLLDPC